MTPDLSTLAHALQTLFTDDADHHARLVGLVRRRRKLTGPVFAQALVFGWLHDPTASLADLADLATQLGGAPVTDSAIDQRLTPAASAFLQALLARAMDYTCAAAQPDASALLARFSGVYIDDSTTIALPAALADRAPGCGGSGGATAAVKVPVRLELRTGALEVSDLQPGRACDLAGPLPHAPLPAGSLRLADLGYYSLEGKALSNSLPVRSIARDFQGSVRTWGQSDGLRGRGVNCYRVLPPRHHPSASGAAPRPGSRAGRAECPPALAHPRRHSCPDTTAAISAD